MAPHSSTLAWKIPWMEEPGRLQSMDTTERLHFSLLCIGEGNGNPLQYSCLENPRDGGAWWAAAYGVAQSQTRLKRLSITFPTKIGIVKAMGFFPVVMSGCESWTIKKGEHWRIDAFELWCWRRLLRITWTARRSNQSGLKEINTEYTFSIGLMLKDWCWSWNSNTLATWCKKPTYWKRPWCWERLRAWREGDERGWDAWMASSPQ